MARVDSGFPRKRVTISEWEELIKKLIGNKLPTIEEKADKKVVKVYWFEGSTKPIKTFKYSSGSYYLTDYIHGMKYYYRPWEA